MTKKEAPTQTDDDQTKKASAAATPSTEFGRVDGATGEQEDGEFGTNVFLLV